jgi:hypothetical protein
MSLLQVFLILIAAGVVLYVVHQVIPLDPKIRTILDVVVILVLLWWLARAFGLVAMLDRPVRSFR